MRSIVPILVLTVLPFMASHATAKENVDSYTKPRTFSFDLYGALNRALAENKSIKAARAEILASAAGERKALSALLPHASASMNVSKINGSNTASSLDYVDQESNIRRLSVNQKIFDLTTIGRYEGASLEYERAALNLQHVELGILYTTEKEFFALLSAIENVKSYQKQVERMKKQVESAQAFYDKQMKPRLHVLQMKTQLAKAESQLSDAENRVETQQAKLVSILGLPEDAVVDFVGDLKKMHIHKPQKLGHYITQALDERPDILIRQKDVKIVQKRKETVKGEFFPTLSGSIDFNQREVDYDKFRDRYDDYVTIGLNLNWNFFDSGASYYGVQEQKQRAQSAKHKLEKLKEDVIAQVKESYLDVLQLEKQISLSKAYVNEAQETYDRSDKRYRLGIGTSTELVDASRELIEAEVSLNRALADYNSALAALYYASGGDEQLKDLCKPKN